MNDFRKNMLKLVLILVGIIVVLILIVTLSTRGSRTTKYTETGLVNAARKYYNSNTSLLPIDDYDESIVTDSTLITEGYLDEYEDEYGYTAVCSSKVTVTKINDEYFYQPYLSCNKSDDTSLLYEELKENIVTEGDGLYSINGEYYFRGENPNNYLSFADMNWKIIKVDKDNNIKIILQDYNYSKQGVWDNRYNIDEENRIGINDYSVSRIKDILHEILDDSKAFDNSSLSRIQKTDLCIGKRNDTDKSTNGNTECSTKLEDQLIGLMQLNEYFIASGDANCPSKSIKSCQNYNYLAIPTWTITAYSGDTSRVWLVTSSSTSIIRMQANESMLFAPVITLKSNTIFTSGEGTQSNPYKIK